MISATHEAAASQPVPSPQQAYPIRRVAVLGAGTMGSRIAAHIANAGLPVLLLDLPVDGDRNRIATRAVEELKRAKPAALAGPSAASLIATGNFDDDLARLKDCDWVIEAVAEKMEIKRSLLDKVSPHLRADAILTTNTSGLPIGALAQELAAGLRRRWFGTHFFNPPRYMQLLEMIATPETDPEAVASVSRFAEIHLGKTIVAAKDSPNFIANRLGTFVLLNTVRIMQQMNLGIEEVDALTGSPLGWPKTGTFRLADMVGIDVLASVARNFTASVRDERPDVELPGLIEEMVSRRWLGDKTGQGFYKKTGEGAHPGNERAGGQRLVLDLKTLEYRPEQKAKLPELDAARSIESLPERIRALLKGNPEKEKAAAFYWKILPELWIYAANRIGEISDSLADIDRAMRAGFNWELGPFEMWDAAGVAETVAAMRSRGDAVPLAAERLLAAGESSWYRNGGREYFRFDPTGAGAYAPVEQDSGILTLTAAKRSNGIVRKNPGASLIDVGDGIACIEFHSKMNTLGQDIVAFLLEVLSSESEAVKSFEGFVITNDAANFSAGANLMQLLLAAQDEEWDEIDLYIRAFQRMTQAIKFCPRPVVAAPFGLCLGGGTEVSLHSALRQAHLELYMGLVETSVGLVPAGGGCKEMAIRAIEAAGEVRADARGESVEVHDSLRTAFETIALAKVSTSAVDARRLGLLSHGDGVTMNRRRLLHDARLQALRLVRTGYTAPQPKTDIPAPGETVLASLRLGIHTMRQAEYISDHDVVVARHAANILCGGSVTPGVPVSEEYLLDLEREAFLSLCGERKTQERIAFTLKTGKPLRN
ncbi:MAG TPA: 3-hydroxyacyl-CoA dehydrogenase NAD-binding domain-containing protein [Acidobacteriaceae bacterium]|nr:3-hydroxyacyl-CoA dehydrogenase NAD-binding domain-containing protein [Acidobacteriaceae bacterium]